MAKYRTIGSDPLDAGREAEPAAAAWVSAANEGSAPPNPASPPPPSRGGGAIAARAAGGGLELLGGDLGVGMAWVRCAGRSAGFVAPNGTAVDLREVASVDAQRDRQEHRAFSILGWAVAVGSIAGPLGGALAGGIRWLHPQRMIVHVRLDDGRQFVALSDNLVVTVLEQLVVNRHHRSEP